MRWAQKRVPSVIWGAAKQLTHESETAERMVPEVGLEPTRRLDPRGILSPVRLPIPPLRHQRFAKGLTSALHTILFMLCSRRLQPTRTLPYGETHPVSRGARAEPPSLISDSLSAHRREADREAHVPLVRDHQTGGTVRVHHTMSLEDRNRHALEGGALSRTALSPDQQKCSCRSSGDFGSYH